MAAAARGGAAAATGGAVPAVTSGMTELVETERVPMHSDGTAAFKFRPAGGKLRNVQGITVCSITSSSRGPEGPLGSKMFMFT